MRSLSLLFLASVSSSVVGALAIACAPEARGPVGPYGTGDIDPLFHGAASSASAAPASTPPLLPDLSHCFDDGAKRGWVKLRVHLAPDGHVVKIEDEGSTAEISGVECAMRVVAQGTFAPCGGCDHYEHHVAFEVEVPVPAGSPPPLGNTWGDGTDGGGTPGPLPPADDVDAGAPSPDEKWM